MTIDWDALEQKHEKEREERKQRDAREKARDRAELAELCTDLEDTLQNPDFDVPALERQGALLDCIVYTLLRRNLRRDKKNGTIDRDDLEHVMRIQKQCVDTLKASAAIDYMNTLVPGQRIIRHIHAPAPAKSDERSIIDAQKMD